MAGEAVLEAPAKAKKIVDVITTGREKETRLCYLGPFRPVERVSSPPVVEYVSRPGDTPEKSYMMVYEHPGGLKRTVSVTPKEDVVSSLGKGYSLKIIIKRSDSTIGLEGVREWERGFLRFLIYDPQIENVRELSPGEISQFFKRQWQGVCLQPIEGGLAILDYRQASNPGMIKTLKPEIGRLVGAETEMEYQKIGFVR